MKKLLAAIFVAILMMPSALAMSSFSDVSEGHQYHDAIEYVKGHGIVHGYEDGTYKPEQNINRAEMLKIIVEAKLKSEISFEGDGSFLVDGFVNEECFSDVPADEWYTPYVCYAKNEGIIAGYPDGTFRPADNISVIESLKILLEAMTDEIWEIPSDDAALDIVLEGMDEDVSDVKGQWYEQYLYQTEFYGLMLDAWSNFDENITRGEMAEIVYRIHFLTKSEVSADQPDDFEMLRDFALGAADISETYFDEHFSYVDSTLNVKRLDTSNWISGYYHIGIAGITKVNYEFMIEDAEGQMQTFTGAVWTYDGEVLEEGYQNVDFYVPEGYVNAVPASFMVNGEKEINITKDEAADIAKAEEQCMDTNWFNDLVEAEANLELDVRGGEIVWVWHSDDSSTCLVNAQTASIDDINHFLPD